MRKLMKKKVNLFGKSVPVFAIVMVAMIGLATAALVPYLALGVSSSMTVDSPMLLSIVEGDLAVYGGETADLNITVTNQAKVNITGETSINVTNSLGVTCGDFSSIMVGMTAPWNIAPVDILLGGSAACWTIDNNTIGLMFGPVEDTYVHGRIDEIQVEATFQQNAYGTYEFNFVVLEP